jgi:hypothetical protein
MLKYSGVEAAQIAEMANAWRRDVTILPAFEVESLLARGGFAAPVLIAQTLLIHAWLARRA